MMSSRVLSRLLPVAEGDVSVYESIRRDGARRADWEAQRRTPSDEPFYDDDDDPDALLLEAQREPEPSESATISPEIRGAEKWLGQGSKRRTEEDEDVPESLLLEPRGKAGTSRPSSQRPPSSSHERTEAQWRATQQHHGLHPQPPARHANRSASRPQTAATAATAVQPNPEAEAMWLYTNAGNLDAFLLEVYEYYTQHGVWSILLSRAISLVTEVFVFSFAMFLTTCIDYKKIPTSKTSTEVLIPQCMAKASWLKNAALFVFIIYWCAKLATYVGDIRRLFRMHNFYLFVLGIDDQDIQTVSWVRVVEGLVKVQNANIATANPVPAVRKYAKYSKPQQRMNAESVANRLMRQTNYYVALYNKDILDFTLPLPFVGSRQFYSKSLEWCINFCLTNFIFDEQGSIRPFCLDVKNRNVLVRALQIRLQFAALTSVVVAPFNIVRFLFMYFFRYYTEFTRNPSKVSARSFAPFAEWKIREVNELDHLFQRRLRQAYPFANSYLKSFPKDKTDQVCRFVAFITGAIAAVLTLATLFDPELFLGFEVTHGRTAVFYLTLAVGIFGVAHGMLPEDDEVHDPVLHLRDVLYYIHHMPMHWKDRLHSNEVRSEFSAMYQMKLLIFVEEITSLIVAPWILFRNSGKRSERIIDFFREQTVHVDGIGYQCNYAVFGFKKDPNAEDATAVLQEPDGLRDDYYGMKDDKMAASMQNFMQYYSHYNHRRGDRNRPQGWQPPPAWPSALSPPAIAEQAEGVVQKPQTSVRPAAMRRSGVLDQRHVLPQRSPRQLSRNLRETRPPSQRPETAKTRMAGSVMHDITESTLIREDSELVAWNHPERDTETETEDDNEDAAKGAGVLGMLYQFSKAQTEKGSGPSI
ncbi:hypothetical protein LTR85_009958 [Meristemomyces frigidus]|nr:hypothetical protein LTR85_009958 [Meristemomyces frigidus]